MNEINSLYIKPTKRGEKERRENSKKAKSLGL